MADRYDQDLILDYVEGDLSPADRVAFEVTLRSDPALRELTQSLATDRAALRGLPDEAPPAHLIEDALQQLERGMLLGDADGAALAVESPHERRLFLGRALAYSGLAAVLLLTSGILISTLTDVDLLDTADRYARVGHWFEDEQPPVAATDEIEGERLARLNDRLPGSRFAPGAADAPADGHPDSARPETPAAASAGERSEALAMRGMGINDEQDPESTTFFGADLSAPQERARRLGQTGGLVGGRSDDSGRPYAAPARAEAAPIRIVVSTRDEGRTRRDILDWAFRNQALVISQPAEPAGAVADRRDVEPLGEGSMMKSLSSAVAATEPMAAADADAEPAPVPAAAAVESAAKAAAVSEPVIVRLRSDEQVPQLLEYLNRYETQRASVAAPAGTVDGRAEPVVAGASANQPAPAESPAAYDALEATEAGDVAAVEPAAPAVAAAEANVEASARTNADADLDQFTLFQQLIEERQRALRQREEATMAGRQGPRNPALPDWLDPLNLKVLPPIPQSTRDTLTAAIYITESEPATDER